MTVDREQLARAFDEYVAQFDKEDERIALKIKHTFLVAENSDRICETMKLNNTQKDTAWAVAMLHDIGRFEQASRTHSFLDSVSNDHAEAGVHFLFEEGGLSRFLPDADSSCTEYSILRLAIRYHNKYTLPKDLSEEQQLFCNIIRDADKLDIFRISLENSFQAVHEYTEEEVRVSPISDAVTECFEKQETLDYSLRKYPADIFLGHIAMAFGLTYPCSRRLAGEQGYVRRMTDFTFAGEAEQIKFERMKNRLEEFLA